MVANQVAIFLLHSALLLSRVAEAQWWDKRIAGGGAQLFPVHLNPEFSKVAPLCESLVYSMFS